MPVIMTMLRLRALIYDATKKKKKQCFQIQRLQSCCDDKLLDVYARKDLLYIVEQVQLTIY